MYPIRVLYKIQPYQDDFHSAHVQMGVTVPKRIFKQAVDRNRIKRKIREAYRMHHSTLLSTAKERGLHLSMMMIYISKDEPVSSKVNHKLKQIIEKCAKKIIEHS